MDGMGGAEPAEQGEKLRCPACGAKVRIPPALARPKARCPRCHSRLDEEQSDPLPESIGSYRVRRRLAAGGMGVVYEAERAGDAKMVAVKVLQQEAHDDENLVDRFEREGRLGMALSHPGLVKVLEAGIDGQRRYLVMELVDGTSLSRHVRKHGPLEWRIVVAILRQCIAALRYLHGEGVIHRDLKPGNVIISGDRARLIDFGLAKLLEGDLIGEEEDCLPLTFAGDQLGTPSYMAPEQVDDSLTVTALADVYGLGATAYFALCGRAPFEGSSSLSVMEKVISEPPKPLRSRNERVPPAMAELVAWTMERDPDRRPDLDELERALTVVAEAPDDANRIRDRRRDRSFRAPWGWILGGALLLVLLGAVAIAIWLVE